MKKKSQDRRSKEYLNSEWDESKSVEVTPEKRAKKSDVSTSIRLPERMIDKLRVIASKKGDIGYQTRLKIWIAERLELEQKKRA